MMKFSLFDLREILTKNEPPKPRCMKCKHYIYWDDFYEYWYCRLCNGDDLDHGCVSDE